MKLNKTLLIIFAIAGIIPPIVFRALDWYNGNPLSNLSKFSQTILTSVITTVTISYCVVTVIIWLQKNYPWRLGISKRLLLEIFLTTLTACSLIIILTLLMHPFSPEKNIKNSIFNYLIVAIIMNFVLVAITEGIFFFRQWKNAAIEAERFKKDSIEAQFETLKNQVNPHFLFNVLNSFYAKALKNNVPELADGIAKLAELMRYMVYETNEDKVALEKEIHHLKNFIQVYQLRIAEDDDVSINFVVKGTVNTVKISPMLLIPFVENAVKHGIDPKTKSIINISIKVEQKKLYFEVTNTIHQGVYGLGDESSGFGLANLKKRLSILYPNRYTLDTKEENGYYISLLILQLD